MSRGIALLRGIFQLFGGLLLYWAVFLLFGVKPAIAATLLFVVVEGAWRLVKRRPFPPLWLFANGAAIIFGIVDLWAQTPFMLRYEGAIFNLLTAAFFAAGASGREPLVMTFARQRRPDIPFERPEIRRFFRAFTYAWAIYFVAKAAVVLWIMTHFPLMEAASIRAIFGWASLGAMMLVSLNGRRVLGACQRLGLFLPQSDDTA